mmetsp:Transcript_13744/g.44892  ORF Transcript_13744/g.44892 Transcript_13744/m.44892 type:complete len:218 (-) Transcript_13744:742-1395(-)
MCPPWRPSPRSSPSSRPSGSGTRRAHGTSIFTCGRRWHSTGCSITQSCPRSRPSVTPTPKRRSRNGSGSSGSATTRAWSSLTLRTAPTRSRGSPPLPPPPPATLRRPAAGVPSGRLSAPPPPHAVPPARPRWAAAWSGAGDGSSPSWPTTWRLCATGWWPRAARDPLVEPGCSATGIWRLTTLCGEGTVGKGGGGDQRPGAAHGERERRRGDRMARK